MDKIIVESKDCGGIGLTLQGKKCCLSVSKGVIKAFGCPPYITLKISDAKDSISVIPCDERDAMSFKVPSSLFTNRHTVMRINSKRFVHGIMLTNDLDISKTYNLSGAYIKDRNTAVFSLVTGVTVRE